MKEFVITEAKVETAVIVGLITPQQNEKKTKEYLDELEFLAETAGANVVRRFTQRVNGPSSITYIGSGKLEEIHDFIKTEEDNEAFTHLIIYSNARSNNGHCSGTQTAKQTIHRLAPPALWHFSGLSYAGH